jgi:hypothetical protein
MEEVREWAQRIKEVHRVTVMIGPPLLQRTENRIPSTWQGCWMFNAILLQQALPQLQTMARDGHTGSAKPSLWQQGKV